MPAQDIRRYGPWIAIVLTLVVTLLLDAITPLGYAEWTLYFLAVALAFFQQNPRGPLLVAAIATVQVAAGAWLSPDGIDPFMANLNRAIGAVGFWILAWVVRDALMARQQVSEALWLEESLAELMVSLRGTQSPETLASNALGVLAQRLDAPIGALYRCTADELVLVGGGGVAGHPAAEHAPR